MALLTFALVAMLVATSVMTLVMTSGGEKGAALHADELWQAITSNMQSYQPTGNVRQILDSAVSVLLPGYAFAQVANALILTPVGSIADNTTDLELDGATGIATFESEGSRYAVVAAYEDNGVQILDITDPADITATSSITDNTTDLELDGARDIAIYESGTSRYAAVTGYFDDGVQILDITDPADITAVGSITDDTNLKINKAWNVAVFESGARYYAVVTGYSDDGVQILNITDPANITAASSITDNTTDLELDGAAEIAIYESGTSRYAAVTGYFDDGVQILDITDPANITAAGSIDNDTNLKLNGARGIAIYESGTSRYAAVAVLLDDGVQILDITDPADITGAGSIVNTAGLNLDGALGIAVFESGDNRYAAVTTHIDDGVQILDITDPADITAAGSITDNTTSPELNGARGIAVFESGGSLYAAVAGYDDDGIQIIRINSALSPIPAGAFVTTWNATVSPYTISIPLEVHASEALTIDWRDGLTDTVTTNGTVSHTYSVSGEYQVSMTGGLSRINLGASDSTADKLISIDQWGDIEWTSMENMFKGASNMEYLATDAPNLSSVTTMASMFSGATYFDGDISSWNVSSVTDMRYIFHSATSFNQTLNDWNVSSVTDMNSMFAGATSFDQPLNDWNVSSVTDMNSMFAGATSFDQPLNDWDVSSVISMGSMFFNADNFDLPLNDWNVSSVTNMNSMFLYAVTFDQPLNDWIVSSVTGMDHMFAGASSFDQPLNDWDVSSVTDMNSMFSNAGDFNRPLNNWDVSSVTDMTDMFDGADSFEQNLGTWYIVPEDTLYDAANDTPLLITNIAAQNVKLDEHVPNYAIGTGDDSELFEMTGSDLKFKTEPPSDRVYTVTVTAPGGDFGTDNHRVLDVTVTGQANTPPTVTAGGSTEVYEGSVGRLTGTASDPDAGDDLEYEWTHDGAASLGIAIRGDDALSTKFDVSGDVESDTQVAFTLTVNDGTSSPVSESFDVDIQDSSGAFIGTWETSNPYTIVQFSVLGTNEVVDWGDGTARTIDPEFYATHTYAKAGQYRVIVDGSIDHVYHQDGASTPTLLKYVDQWGDIEWSSMENMFRGASNMEYRATDVPDLSRVSSMSSMFRGASSFNGDISSWTVSEVSAIMFMFDGASSFNGDISSWNTSSVTDMVAMFRGASSFNSSISSWNVSSVTDMSFMFERATSFNQPLNDWDVSSVVNTEAMFNFATSFNQPLNWDVSSVTRTGFMFFAATSFNQPLNDWNVSSVTSMDSMFEAATSFNQPLNDWDVSSVTHMRSLFFDATSFNQPLNDWNVSSVTSMNFMFLNATAFEQNLGAWYVVPADTSYAISEASLNVTTISAQNFVLDNHTPNYDIGTGDNSNLFNMTGSTLMFKNTPPDAGEYTVTVTAPGGDFGTDNHRVLDVTVTGVSTVLPTGAFATTWKTNSAGQSISIPVEIHTGRTLTIDWGDGSTGTVTTSGTQSHTYSVSDEYQVNMTGGLSRINLNSNGITAAKLISIDQWGDIEWSNMEYMFKRASNMEYNASDEPNLSGVTSMKEMFYRATDFDGDLSGWDVSNVENMDATFYETSFNGDISGWDVSSVNDMNSMFYSAGDFDQDLSSWNTASVTVMSNMFNGATSFTSDLSSWNTTSVTRMSSMFAGAAAFNGDISGWDVSGVTNMASMFTAAANFNSDISGWDVSGVTNMEAMFINAANFNSDISGWDVSGVTNMEEMFDGATAFDQNLGAWYVVPDSTEIARADVPDVVGTISAQNSELNDHIPVYGIGTGGDSARFEIVNGNKLNMTSVEAKSAYTVNVTASGSSIFEDDGNNWLMLDVTVTGEGNSPPSIDAGLNQRVLDGSAVALNGTAADADGDSMTYSWAQTGGSPTVTLTGSDTLMPTFAAPDVSSDVQLTFQLTVNDGIDSVTDTVTVTIHDAAADFVTTWDVSIGLRIPVGGTGNYAVDWGDGTFNSGWSGDSSHLYAGPGTYTVRISGDFPDIRLFDSPADAPKLQSIEQWGDIGWTSMEGAFSGASNMEYNAADAPDLSSVTDMNYMFYSANAFDGDISGWDVSSVTNMRFMFYDARTFDGDISGWDVSGVTSMERMLDNADAFDGDISGWDVSNVQHMGAMFRGAAAFNQDISSWDVSSVTSMSLMFENTNSFDRPLNDWDVSNVQNMGGMFRDTDAFDRPLNDWDVSNVQNMNDMFRGAAAFNQDISSWDVSSVTSMLQMFGGAVSFEQNLGEWYVVLDKDYIVKSDIPGIVGEISAQNSYLEGHNPVYEIGSGGDSNRFEIVNGNMLNMTSAAAKSAYMVTVTVTGRVFGTDNSHVLDVDVTVGPNTPPVLDSIGSHSVDELDTLTFTATARDDDGDPLTFTLTGNRPRGASITPGGFFEWTPDQSQDGEHFITVQVSDGKRGGTDSEVVAVTVNDIAPLPVSARASSSSAIALTLSEAVTSGGQGPNGFSVTTTGGDLVSVESITGSGTATLTLNLDGTISATDGDVKLSYSAGDVEDLDDNPLASFSEIDVLFPSQRRGGGTTPPAVDLGTLAYQRLADIPPHIAEQVASHDDSDPLEPITLDGTFDFPLVINTYGYLLDDTTNTLVPQTVSAGDDSTTHITFTVYTQKDLAHFTLYLNLSDENTDYADSDTYITYKDDGTTVVTDPHGYIDSATITVTQEDDSVPERKTVRITVEFAEPMGPTNMVAYMWNTDRKAAFIKIIDAFEVAAALLEPEVQAADPEPVQPDDQMPADPEPIPVDDQMPANPEPVPSDALWPADDYDEAQALHIIRMWSGFDLEFITDEQMLTSLGLDYPDADIPDWVMTELGVLAAKGDVTVGEFMLALQYVLENL